MNFQFLIDNHLSPALVSWLKAKGHQAEHVRNLALNQASDLAIWHHAAKERCVIVTKDEDFADLSLLRTETVPVIWLRIGNCRTPVLLASLEAARPQIEEKLAEGEQIVEVY